MRVDSSAYNQAMKLRGFFVSEFLKYHGPTDSSAGVTLVQKGVEYGYTKRIRPVPGKTLRVWSTTANVPQWAVKTISKYILGEGYIPDTDNELDALLINLVIDIDDCNKRKIIEMLDFENISAEELDQSLSRIWHAKLE